MFQNFRDSIKSFFGSLSRTMKIALISGVAAGVILLTFLILFITRTEYIPIANGLDVESARQITGTLDQLGIPWKEEGGLTVILVPKKDVSRARMELAVTLKSGSISWADVFSSDNFTMTTGTREQMYVQAQATELKNAIETLENVKSAKVILYIPKDSNYFLTLNSEARASIVLTLVPGAQMDSRSVSGITNLVVSAVKGLEAKNVTIINEQGVQLNEQNTGDAEFTASNQFELKSGFEKKIQSDLLDFLGTIYGKGNVGVQASVSLDFDKESETRTTYSPPVEGETTGLVRSLTRIRENVSSESGLGVPGTDTNTTSVTEGSDTGVYEKASEVLNYELNQTVKLLEKAEGQVKELSVAVLINSKVLQDEILTDEHRAELIDLVSRAVGTPQANITVLSREFPDPLSSYNVYLGDDDSGQLQTFLIIGVAAVAAILIIVVIIVIVVRKRKKQAAEEEQRKLEEIKKIEAETEEILGEIGEKEDKGSPKYHIERFIDKNPEAAVVLLRAWINE